MSLCGCFSLGNTRLYEDRLGYSRALGDAEKSDTLLNVVPACRSCNTSKCNDEVTGWLRRKRLSEGTFLLRHIEVCTELARTDPS